MSAVVVVVKPATVKMYTHVEYLNTCILITSKTSVERDMYYGRVNKYPEIRVSLSVLKGEIYW